MAPLHTLLLAALQRLPVHLRVVKNLKGKMNRKIYSLLSGTLKNIFQKKISLKKPGVQRLKNEGPLPDIMRFRNGGKEKGREPHRCAWNAASSTDHNEVRIYDLLDHDDISAASLSRIQGLIGAGARSIDRCLCDDLLVQVQCTDTETGRHLANAFEPQHCIGSNA